MNELKTFIDEALRHHREGRLQEAKCVYEKILQTRPDQVDALHMLGVIAYQEGDNKGAISRLERVRELAPCDAGVYLNLGNALCASGRLDDAVLAFQKAIEINPESAMAYNNLGNILRKQGELSQSMAAYKKALSLDEGYTDVYVNLAAACQAAGDNVHAASLYERAVMLDPGNKSAAHMLAALRGEVTDGAPREHVEQLFDEYAERFDHHLINTLGYSMPDKLRSEIERKLGTEVFFENVIDLGCGTGLTGVAFRDICGKFVGVDLSSGMIDRARERGIYDDLRIGDVVTVLEADTDCYDLFICADVFPYIGKVQPLFAAVRNHARNGALFAFSTELSTEADFTLRLSGRYAHSQDYLSKVSAESGFSVISMRTENLRKQKGEWIPGDLVVLRYQG